MWNLRIIWSLLSAFQCVRVGGDFPLWQSIVRENYSISMSFVLSDSPVSCWDGLVSYDFSLGYSMLWMKWWHLFKQVGWFNFDPEFHVESEQMCCYLTQTTEDTYQIVTDNLDKTPTYGGWVKANGPRYCLTIDDKVLHLVYLWSVISCNERICFHQLWVILTL